MCYRHKVAPICSYRKDDSLMIQITEGKKSVHNTHSSGVRPITLHTVTNHSRIPSKKLKIKFLEATPNKDCIAYTRVCEHTRNSILTHCNRPLNVGFALRRCRESETDLKWRSCFPNPQSQMFSKPSDVFQSHKYLVQWRHPNRSVSNFLNCSFNYPN